MAEHTKKTCDSQLEECCHCTIHWINHSIKVFEPGQQVEKGMKVRGSAREILQDSTGARVRFAAMSVRKVEMWGKERGKEGRKIVYKGIFEDSKQKNGRKSVLHMTANYFLQQSCKKNNGLHPNDAKRFIHSATHSLNRSIKH
jgi:hypothetical protein